MEIEQDMNIDSTESANDVYLFLKENNFLQLYWSSFDREDYDDMKQLLEMTPDELEQALAQDIGIKKIGHLKRLKALLAIHSTRGNSNEKEYEDKDAKKSSNKTQKLSASIASRLLIPNPITEKHKFYNELLYELFNDSYELMTHDAFILYVTGQRQSRWKIKQRLDSMRLYKIKLAESKDGHWQNIRKYVGDQVMLTSKDRKPAERCVEFMAGIIQEVDSFIVECKTLRSNLFDKENTVKPWKADELLFLENIIKDLSAIDTKMVKAKGDIFQNVCYLRRRVLESEAIQHDNSRSKRRMKENKRKSSNRKEQREAVVRFFKK
ncbi:uncharacterized protein LOC110249849 [Paramuricea clavata]|uniref:Uncharacterized protein LOC110249849 n=1 Tax=Paramuricea clavata TaxID=317549 RepID=A0A6S7ICS7_PARCT|nr:uncharacterized protein LOC110249849 [Paramuricea clavata]